MCPFMPVWQRMRTADVILYLSRDSHRMKKWQWYIKEACYLRVAYCSWKCSHWNLRRYLSYLGKYPRLYLKATCTKCALELIRNINRWSGKSRRQVPKYLQLKFPPTLPWFMIVNDTIFCTNMNVNNLLTRIMFR